MLHRPGLSVFSTKLIVIWRSHPPPIDEGSFVSLSLHWFLPTAGDSRDVVGFGPTRSRRPADLDYLSQVARVAEQVGFDAVLTPTGTFCEDAWLTTAALIRDTKRLRFLVAFRPGLISPTLAAQQAATFQRLSGGPAPAQHRHRRQRGGATALRRPPRPRPALRALRRVPHGAAGRLEGRPFDFAGRHYQVESALVSKPPDPRPAIFFGGSSDAGKDVAARQADVWLMWGEPPASAAAELASVRQRAEALGRDVQFGIRLHTITRDRAADAWAEADRLAAAMPDDVIARAQALVAKQSQSVGQARMAALHGGDRNKLVIAPDLWAGFGLVRGGPAPRSSGATRRWPSVSSSTTSSASTT